MLDLNQGQNTKNTVLSAAVFCAVFLLCILLSAAQVMVEPGINDEHMYLAAAKLLDTHSLYSDFAFFQSPYMVYVYRWAMALLSDAGILMTARLLKLLLLVMTLFFFSWLLLRYSGSIWMACVLLYLFFSSAVFRSDLQYARNYQLPLLLSLVALVIIDYALVKGNSSFWSYFWAGICFGLAVGVKITFLLLAGAMALTLPFFFKGFAVRLRVFFSFCIGGLAALSPFCLLWDTAGWERIQFNLFGYHQVNALWRLQEGYTQGMDPLGKARLGVDQLMNISNSAVLFLLFLLIIQTFRSHDVSLKEGQFRLRQLSAFSVAALLLYLIPTPAWVWYLTPFWLFLFLLTAVLYTRLGNSAERKGVHALMVLLIVVTSLVNIGNDRLNLERVLDTDQWYAVGLRKEAMTLKAHMLDRRLNGKVATLRPLYAIEAGLDIYPELATADFAYRIGDFLSEWERKLFRISSPATVYSLLMADPPAAIICGFVENLEKPFNQFAVDHGYEKNDRLIRGGLVYLRKSGKVEE